MEQEIRKHYTQLTLQEKDFLGSFINNKNEYRLDAHAIKRGAEKIITNDSIERAIHNGKIIEYHYKEGNRILVRGNIDENGYNICTVIDCDNLKIITVFYNSLNDVHFTLNRSLYRKNFDVVSMFKKKKKCGNNGCFGNTYKQNNTKLILN